MFDCATGMYVVFHMLIYVL